MRDRIGFETKLKIGWCERGTRARQFKATSFGREGIKIVGSSDGGSAAAAEEDMSGGWEQERDSWFTNFH